MVSVKYKYIFKLDKRTATDLIFLLFQKIYINDINLHHSTLNQVPTFGCCVVVAFVCFILEVKIIFSLYF